MQTNAFTKDGIVAIIASLLIIAGAIYWFMNFGPSADRIERQNETPIGYATEDEFPDANVASGEEIERALVDAFKAGRLLEILSIDIPDTNGDALVLAAPTLSGAEEAVDCGIRSHKFCALFRKSPDDDRILLWGNKLAGFAGVERFIDSNHVIIATAWSMLNFTSIERQELNLENGELLPKLLIELDEGDDFGEMQIRGHGDDVSLWIEGSYDRGRVVPERIVVRNAANHDEIYQEMDREAVAHFAESVAASEEPIQPIFVLPSDTDMETLIISIELYGEPYAFDLNTREILPLQEESHDES